MGRKSTRTMSSERSLASTSSRHFQCGCSENAFFKGQCYIVIIGLFTRTTLALINAAMPIVEHKVFPLLCTSVCEIGSRLGNSNTLASNLLSVLGEGIIKRLKNAVGTQREDSVLVKQSTMSMHTQIHTPRNTRSDWAHPPLCTPLLPLDGYSPHLCCPDNPSILAAGSRDDTPLHKRTRVWMNAPFSLIHSSAIYLLCFPIFSFLSPSLSTFSSHVFLTLIHGWDNFGSLE